MASIEKKTGKAGTTYQVRYRSNYQSKAKTFKRLKDARAFKSRIEHELLSNAYYEYPKLRVSELLDRWLVAHEPRVRATTFHDYKRIVKIINKYIGHIPLAKLTAIDIENMYLLYGENRASRTVYWLHQVLSIAFKFAYKSRLIKSSPMDLVTPPKKKKVNVNTMAFDDIPKYLDCVKDHWVYPAVCLYMFLGMRRGEIYALTWDHVDFDKNTIFIEWTETVLEGKLIKQPPKNGESRYVPLPASLASTLKAHKQWQDDRASELLGYLQTVQEVNYVITKDDLERPMPKSISQAFMKRQIIAGLDHVSLHSLKHTASTLMGYSGMDKKVASTILAHRSVEFTDKVYRYVFDEQMKVASDALNNTIIDNFEL